MARYVSVRHILQLIKLITLKRYIQKVDGTRTAESNGQPGQQHRFPIHDDIYIAKATLQIQCGVPASIFIFFQRPAGAAGQTNRKAGCVWCLQAKACTPIRFKKHALL